VPKIKGLKIKAASRAYMTSAIVLAREWLIRSNLALTAWQTPQPVRNPDIVSFRSICVIARLSKCNRLGRR
jgi:hypothetical protein